MTPEEEARELIDELLSSAGWSVQDFQKENFGASVGVAVREFKLKTGAADYLLFVNRKVVGVIEAKPVGHTLGGVDYQSEKYVEGLVGWIEPLCLDPDYPIPFLYESTGAVTYFRDLRDPDSRSRRVFAFHRPETLRDWLKEHDTLRGRIRTIPPLKKGSLRDCQFNAIQNLEQSLRDQRPRALIQMATGSGKTYMTVEASYRLIKYAKARRILFLVDRNNLGRQAFLKNGFNASSTAKEIRKDIPKIIEGKKNMLLQSTEEDCGETSKSPNQQDNFPHISSLEGNNGIP